MAAIKAFHILSSIFFLLIIFCKFGHAKRNFPTHKISSSAFDVIKDLEGCGNGNNTKGINLVKAYLQRFGYLHLPNQTTHDDVFDETLELALKTYQKNYHIEPSGILDSTTLTQMTSPRCGVPDIINGTNHMKPRNKKNSAPAPAPEPTSQQQFETVSHYTFFDGNPRWPSSQTHLTYAFLPNTPERAMAPVASAFQIWADATQFTFSEAKEYEEADLNIGFFSGDHGDGSPFDGIGRVLAHSFPPTDGRFHYDADELWSVGAVPGEMDLESVAVHEIGHLLGLGHSQIEEAIMYPAIPAGVSKINLHPDDIEGIQDLYSF